MKIKVDSKYQIISDPVQYILQEKKIAREGDKKGDEYWVNVGYHGAITSALKSYKELQIRNSEVTTVDELFKLIKKLDQKIEKFLGGN